MDDVIGGGDETGTYIMDLIAVSDAILVGGQKLQCLYANA